MGDQVLEPQTLCTSGQWHNHWTTQTDNPDRDCLFTLSNQCDCLFIFVQPMGLFSLLDEESKFPSGTDQSLIDKLTKNFAKKTDFQRPRGQGLDFLIRHFAGLVGY